MKNFCLLIIGLSFLVPGCGSYPVKKDNILASPIHIEMPAIDDNVLIPKDEFVNKLLQHEENNLIDQLGREKATDYALKLYEKYADFREKPADDRINQAIWNGLTRNKQYIHIAKRGVAESVSINRPHINWTGDKGVATVKVDARWTAGNLPFNGLGNLTINIAKSVSDKSIRLDILNLSYVLECTYLSGVGCNLSDDFFILDESLISALKTSYSAPSSKPTIDVYPYQLRNYLKKRYSTENVKKAVKIEKLFKIDFVTAKSRLQRAMSNFKYDDKKSTFTFFKEFRNMPNGLTTRHNYIISLFPDRNNTVVEFGGDYQGITDSFGGNTLYGKSFYDSEVDKYISQVTKILSK